MGWPTRIALLAAATLVAGCSSPLIRPSTATFTVTGTAKHIDVAYGMGAPIWHGNTLPFSATLSGVMPRDAVYITAQIDTSPDDGSITVTISKDGAILYQASATGYPNTATASGPF